MHSPETSAAGAHEKATRQQLQAFLTSEAMTMAFQPVVDLRSGQAVGAEALARFDAEPRRGPDFWFAEAWRLGLGVALELEAIRRALRALVAMPPNAYLAINAAPKTLFSKELLSMLDEVPAERIVVELTEHEPVEDYVAMNLALAALRSRGARLSIDDAGAGFSSFQHVLQLRPDIIKLDRSLTTGVDSNPVRFALASALVTFAASLGARVCAEGIETAAELVALQKLGVRTGQGYFLARPAPLPLASPPPGYWTTSSIRPSERVRAAVASPATRSRERVQALADTGLMDSASEEDFDRFTRLASLALRAPIALISLVDTDRQFFKSALGVGDLRETPISHSFCQHVVATRRALRIDDARIDPRVQDNPALEQLGVVAYAGAPIFTEGSHAVGALCAMALEPRAWSDADMDVLAGLAELVSEQISQRVMQRQRDSQIAVLDLVLEHASAIALLADARGRILRASALFCAMTGYAESDLIGRLTTELWHPDDGSRAVLLRNQLLAGEQPVVRGVTQLKHASGHWLRVEVKAALARIPNASATYTLLDLTLRPD